MKRKLTFAIVYLIAAGLVGCASGTSSTEDELALDEIPELDAGTDAVPVADAEQPIADAPPAEWQPAPELAATEPTAEQPPADQPPADPSMTPPSDPAPYAEAPPATDPSFAAGTAGESTSSSDFSFSPAMSDEFQVYTVSAGDTLMKIAFETYGDLYQWKRIYEDNKDKIQNPNALSAGLQLNLPKPAESVQISRNGEKYIIKTGDTLGKISGDIYGTPRKWRKLWENNKQLIKDPNKIFAGFFLYYTMTPEEHDEADRLKQSQPMAPPLASGGDAGASDRNPASMAPPAYSESAAPAPSLGAAPAPGDGNMGVTLAQPPGQMPPAAGGMPSGT